MTNDSRYRVRPCGLEDASLLRAIRLEALRDTPEAYGSTYEEAILWTPERWEEAADQWNCFLGECEDEIVGMASGGQHDRLPGSRWLFGMYVTPKARGTGVAELLVDAVSEWARGEGAEHIYLSVATLVPRARAFYDKVGFRESGEVHTMQRDPSIQLVTMVRDLV